MKGLIDFVQSQYDLNIKSVNIIYEKGLKKYYKIQTDEKFFLKNYGNNREEVEKELYKISILNTQDYGIRYLRNKYNSATVKYYNTYYMLYPYYEPFDISQTKGYGKATVNFWRVINSCNMEIERTRNYFEREEYNICIEKCKKPIIQYFDEEKFKILKKLSEINSDKVGLENYSIIHGDMTLNNMLFNGERLILIDYEDVCRGDFYADIATMVISFCSKSLIEECKLFLSELESIGNFVIDYKKLNKFIYYELMRSIIIILKNNGIYLRVPICRIVVDLYINVIKRLVIANNFDFQL